MKLFLRVFITLYILLIYLYFQALIKDFRFYNNTLNHLIFTLFPFILCSFFICLCGSHHHLFVIYSSFLYLPVRLAPSFVRHLFVICSSFVRLLFVFCSSFVRLLFVFCSSFVYLPVRLAPARVAHTVFTKKSV